MTGKCSSQINKHSSNMNTKEQLILIRPWRRSDLLLLSISTQRLNRTYSQTQINPTGISHTQAERRNENRRKQALERRQSSEFHTWDPLPPHRRNYGLPEHP